MPDDESAATASETGPPLDAVASLVRELDALALAGEWRRVRDRVTPIAPASLVHTSVLVRYVESLLLTGNPAAAHACCSAALPSVLRSANRSAIRRVLNLAGAAAFEVGATLAAAEHFERAREESEAAGDTLQLARAANNLALVASVRGLRDQALAWYAVAIPNYQRTGDLRGVAETYHNMAITLREEAQWARAIECERCAMDYALRLGQPRIIAFVRVGLAENLLCQGDARLAQFSAERAATEFGVLGEPAFEADALRVVALAARRRGQPEDAIAILRRALARVATTEHPMIEAECLAALGESLLPRHADHDEGKRLLRQAASTFASVGARDKASAARQRVTEI